MDGLPSEKNGIVGHIGLMNGHRTVPRRGPMLDAGRELIVKYN